MTTVSYAASQFTSVCKLGVVGLIVNFAPQLYMMTPQITLKKGKEASPLRRHHWIFSGAIAGNTGDLKDGDLVEVVDFKKNKIATGYFNQGSIAVKILAFGNEHVDENFYIQKFSTAFDLRKAAGLHHLTSTNAYRLFHAEGDGIPGIVIDNYNGHVVVQVHHQFVLNHLDMLMQAFKKVYPQCKSIYLKFTQKFSSDIHPFYFNQDEETLILENNIKFNVNWVKGQKTGFFLDQRDNRNLLGKYSEGKHVLNTFCYTGGFSLYALANGAAKVTSVDSSAYAIEQVGKNIETNGLASENYENLSVDALDYLTKTNEGFDLIILDPPAFAKSISARHNAIMAYKRINALALQKIKSNSILFTYSCSQVVDKFTFTNTVLSAAIETGREVKIMHQLSQPADHPINIFHPETEYLKGLVLFVK